MEKGRSLGCQAEWPLFYMNDFSRLGLLVPDLEQTLRALKARGYLVHENEQGCLLEVDSRDHLNGAFAALAEQQVAYELADLISCVYQG
jgi:hypothetical protein